MYITHQGSTHLPRILHVCNYTLHEAHEDILNAVENKFIEYENKTKQIKKKIHHNYSTSVKLEEFRDRTVYVKAENIYIKNR